MSTDAVFDADSFWVQFLGVEAPTLRTDGLVVVPHRELGDYNGVWFFVRRGRLIVSAPPAWTARLRSALSDVPLDRIGAPALFEGLFGGDLDRVIGPTYQGYLAEGRFRPASAEGVRLFDFAASREDRALLERLRGECEGQGWDDSGVDLSRPLSCGRLVDGRLVAIAQYRARLPGVGDPCVLTHPDYRGQGHGAAVTSAVIKAAFAEQRVLIYQTLRSNLGAVAIAARLGYEDYATHWAVRLKPGADPRPAKLG